MACSGFLLWKEPKWRAPGVAWQGASTGVRAMVRTMKVWPRARRVWDELPFGFQKYSQGGSVGTNTKKWEGQNDSEDKRKKGNDCVVGKSIKLSVLLYPVGYEMNRTRTFLERQRAECTGLGICAFQGYQKKIRDNRVYPISGFLIGRPLACLNAVCSSKKPGKKTQMVVLMLSFLQTNDWEHVISQSFWNPLNVVSAAPIQPLSLFVSWQKKTFWRIEKIKPCSSEPRNTVERLKNKRVFFAWSGYLIQEICDLTQEKYPSGATPSGPAATATKNVAQNHVAERCLWEETPSEGTVTALPIYYTIITGGWIYRNWKKVKYEQLKPFRRKSLGCGTVKVIPSAGRGENEFAEI